MGTISDVDYNNWSNKDFTPEVVGLEDESDKDAEQECESDKIATESNKLVTELKQMSEASDKKVDHECESNKSVTKSNKLVTESNNNKTLDGSPELRSVKRSLNISPSTPVGMARKHILYGTNRNVQYITFSEDVEMMDLNIHDQASGMNEHEQVVEPTPVGHRKIVRAGRMKTVAGSYGALSRPAVLSMPSQDKKEGAEISNMKGISIKSLQKSHRGSTRNKKLNYKATRKKKENKPSNTQKLEGGQRVIHDYFASVFKNNQLIVGPDTDVNGDGLAKEDKNDL